MWSAFFREISTQYQDIRTTVRTREFWIYFALVGALLGILIGLAYMAAGFDELTRQQALLAIACRAGDAQLLTIIVGGMVFGLLCLFTIGEVVYWVEDRRQARAAHRRSSASTGRLLTFVIGALVLGGGGLFLLTSWCH